ncbi:hypothetical protein [Mycobacterium sp.]|uniref:hypothetical protein n=1 Tax=Mycobacterium sp. TaxID=1785 RepID=UPI003C756261
MLLGGRDLLGLSIKRVRVGVAERSRLDIEMLRALAGDAHGGADAFGQGGEPEPGLLHRLGSLRQR